MSLFKCCFNCKPPIRHEKCHSTCKEYKRDREILDKRNEELEKIKAADYRVKSH